MRSWRLLLGVLVLFALLVSVMVVSTQDMGEEVTAYSIESVMEVETPSAQQWVTGIIAEPLVLESPVLLMQYVTYDLYKDARSNCMPTIISGIFTGASPILVKQVASLSDTGTTEARSKNGDRISPLG